MSLFHFNFTASTGLVPSRTTVSASATALTPVFIQPGSTDLSPACEVSLNSTIVTMHGCGYVYDEATDQMVSNVAWGSTNRKVFADAKISCTPDASGFVYIKDFIEGMDMMADGCRQAFATSEEAQGSGLASSSVSASSTQSLNIAMVIGVVCATLTVLVGAIVLITYRRHHSVAIQKRKGETDGERLMRSSTISMRSEHSGEPSDAMETVPLHSLAGSEKTHAQTPATPLLLQSVSQERRRFEEVDPADWKVSQTVAWLAHLNYPPEVQSTFEEMGVDGMFLKVLSRSRESCKEVLKNDLNVDHVRTRALLADSIVSLFEARNIGVEAHALLPGYSQ
ncbi:hypothetical protein CcCBS67573_g09623 [Chytriomyces confervae]|uniref:SAM domain-containing protein n=1 Tax=Chytriomyces confervae TaxID=246404 RepID=A0A507DS84_9FUNG|nr:hypothetical protein CcCBS67573_g09623 [Chytriomyces confervae]